jgi:hypothetical protein
MAAVGGVAYAAGRSGANRAAQEQTQDEQIAELQAQQAAAPQPVAPSQPAPPPPAAPAEMTSDDRLRQLRELGELKSSGVLTDEEFQREKARLLGTA